MKKTLAFVLAAFMVGSVCLFGACKKENAAPAGDGASATAEDAAGASEPAPVAEGKERIALPYAATVDVDPETVEVSDFQLSDKKGNWSITLHLCDSAEDLESYSARFDGNLNNDENTDVKTEEKTLGAYTYQTETHLANGQNFGTYFAVADPPVPYGEDNACYGIFCYLWLNANDAETLREVDDVIASILLGATAETAVETEATAAAETTEAAELTEAAETTEAAGN